MAKPSFLEQQHINGYVLSFVHLPGIRHHRDFDASYWKISKDGKRIDGFLTKAAALSFISKAARNA